MARGHLTVTRRQFMRGLGAGVVLGGGGIGAAYQWLASTASLSAAQQDAAAPGIEPNTIRRRGVGLRGHDPQRAFKGFTLFAPATGDGMVYLIDM